MDAFKINSKYTQGSKRVNTHTHTPLILILQFVSAELAQELSMTEQLRQ